MDNAPGKNTNFQKMKYCLHLNYCTTFMYLMHDKLHYELSRP